MWVEGIILVLSILFAAMSAAAETALTALNPAALRVLEERGGVGRIIAYLRSDPNRFLTTILIVSSTSLIVASSMATLLFTKAFPTPWGELAATVGMSILVLLFAELTPKNIAVRKPNVVAAFLARPVRTLEWLLRPVNTVAGLVVGGIMAALGQGGGSQMSHIVTEEDVRSTLTLAEESEGLTEEETERIEGVLDLDTISAGEVMKPRNLMVAVDVEMPILEALDVILEKGHSRIPVYEENYDHIVGILYDKDLLRYIRRNETDVDLRQIVRQPVFVPETKHADDLLREFQRRKVHMAIVVDEYGGTAGLVTIEDLLEEIVGEIQDEYDAEEPPVVKVSDQEYIFDAGLRIEDVNDAMDIDLETENSVETLGGLIFDRLGQMPKVGDCVSADHVTLEVTDIEGNRIKKVRVTRVPDAETDVPNLVEE